MKEQQRTSKTINKLNGNEMTTQRITEHLIRNKARTIKAKQIHETTWKNLKLTRTNIKKAQTEMEDYERALNKLHDVTEQRTQ